MINYPHSNHLRLQGAPNMKGKHSSSLPLSSQQKANMTGYFRPVAGAKYVNKIEDFTFRSGGHQIRFHASRYEKGGMHGSL